MEVCFDLFLALVTRRAVITASVSPSCGDVLLAEARLDVRLVGLLHRAAVLHGGNLLCLDHLHRDCLCHGDGGEEMRMVKERENLSEPTRVFH